MPPGTGTITVRVRDSSTGKTGPTVSFTYDPPNIDVLAPTSVPTQGGVNITLTGSNFGARSLNDTNLVLTVAGVQIPRSNITEHVHNVRCVALRCVALRGVALNVRAPAPSASASARLCPQTRFCLCLFCAVENRVHRACGCGYRPVCESDGRHSGAKQ